MTTNEEDCRETPPHEACEAKLRRLELALREAEQRAETKAHLLALVGHELATPLQTIRLTLDLFERETASVPDTVKARVGFILRAANQLRSMVEPLLEYVRVDADRFACHRVAVALPAECDALLAPYRDLADARELRLCLEVEPELPEAEVDRNLFRLALGNLVSNAIKYSSCGTIRIAVRRDGRDLSLVVQDEGHGIPSEALDRIFEPFERLTETHERPTPGVGLGLALLKETLSKQGGEVSVRSAVGVGSTFHVRLPGCFGDALETDRGERAPP
jgi:signal transduction histidine kinase